MSSRTPPLFRFPHSKELVAFNPWLTTFVYFKSPVAPSLVFNTFYLLPNLLIQSPPLSFK